MRNFFIYLSGSIKKSNSKSDGGLYWNDQHVKELKELLLEEGINVIFLNPASRSDDLSDELSLFGRDTLQVFLSNIVLADMRDRRGVGIGYEVAFANSKNIPVLSWAKKNSHYRPEELDLLGQKVMNWTHPFVSQTSKAVVENLSDSCKEITKLDISKKRRLTIDDYPTKAIKHYLSTQLSRDKEMNELIHQHIELSKQIDEINKISNSHR